MKVGEIIIFDSGDRVAVVSDCRSKGETGTVTKYSNYPCWYEKKYVGVRLDNGEFKQYNEKSLSYINESEENNMSKLTGYKAVAVVNQGYKDYHFAIYEDNMEYHVGDKVIVSGSDTIHTITEIITQVEATQRFKGDITAEVISIVDMSAYEERVEKRKAAEELKKSMDKAIREMQEVDKYEMYAKQNPVLKDMLDKYKELVE